MSKDTVSFSQAWEDNKPTDFEDTVEKRLDFVSSICRDDDGETVDNAEIHRLIQSKIYQWEQEGIKRGMVRVPYGIGKSTQITQALNLYALTVNPNHLIIILSGKPDDATSRVQWMRNIIENSDDYTHWCEENGLEPLTLSAQDTGSTKRIYVERTSTSPHPSVAAKGVNEGGTGYRATRLTPDDIVNRKNSQYQAEREDVHGNWVNTWSKRVKPNGTVYGVFTPYHPKDANMKMLDTGMYAELKIQVAEDKENYEMFEFHPTEDREGRTLVDKDLNVPLWVEGDHDRQWYLDKEAEDETAYSRGYEMNEDAVEEGDRAYAHYVDEYYPKGNVTSDFDYEPFGATVYLVVDFNYNPQCWSLAQRQGRYHIFFDELRKRNMTTLKMAKAMADKLLEYKPKPITFVNVIGDATPRKGREGYDDYDAIKDGFSEKNIGYSIKTGRSNPSVRNSITHLNKGFNNSKGQKSILVHERCKHLRRDFRKTERNDDGKIEDKDSDLSHFSDGGRYYWWYMKKGSKKRKYPKLR